MESSLTRLKSLKSLNDSITFFCKNMFPSSGEIFSPTYFRITIYLLLYPDNFLDIYLETILNTWSRIQVEFARGVMILTHFFFTVFCGEQFPSYIRTRSRRIIWMIIEVTTQFTYLLFVQSFE